MFNLINFFILLKKETLYLLKDLEISYFEYLILYSISRGIKTQYSLAKKHGVSKQRVHQIIKKLIEKGYIEAEIEEIRGRFLKLLTLSLEASKILEEVDNEIKNKLKEKKVDSEFLREIDVLLENLLQESTIECNNSKNRISFSRNEESKD